MNMALTLALALEFIFQISIQRSTMIFTGVN